MSDYDVGESGFTAAQERFIQAQIKTRLNGPMFTTGSRPVAAATPQLPGVGVLQFPDSNTPVLLNAGAIIRAVNLADVACAAGPTLTSLGLTFTPPAAGYWWARWMFGVTNPAAGSSQVTAQPTAARIVRAAAWGIDFGAGLNTGANHQALNRPDGTQGSFVNSGAGTQLVFPLGDMSATPYFNWCAYEGIFQCDGLGAVDMTIQPVTGDTCTIGRGAYLLAQRLS